MCYVSVYLLVMRIEWRILKLFPDGRRGDECKRILLFSSAVREDFVCLCWMASAFAAYLLWHAFIEPESEHVHERLMSTTRENLVYDTGKDN